MQTSGAELTGNQRTLPRAQLLRKHRARAAFRVEEERRTRLVAELRKARLTGITAYLSNGGTLEHAQQIAGHAADTVTVYEIDREVPVGLDIHLVLDNYATHKHVKVQQWLPARPRYHLHFTPTYSSWLNQVERWFGLLSQRAIKRGSFRSVPDLVSKIQAFIDSYNASATPFVWVATGPAQSIIDKVARIAMRISGTAH